MDKDEENKLLRAMLQALSPGADALLKKVGVKTSAKSAKAAKKTKTVPVDEKAVMEAFKHKRKTCPHCGKDKLVVPDFGVRRTNRGKLYAQPWCTTCRATTNYHARPRKNYTVNGSPND